MSRENVDAGRIEGADAVFRGPAEMRRFGEEWHSVWDLTIDVSEARDLGNTVLVLGRIRARGGASEIEFEEA